MSECYIWSCLQLTGRTDQTSKRQEVEQVVFDEGYFTIVLFFVLLLSYASGVSRLGPAVIQRRRGRKH